MKLSKYSFGIGDRFAHQGVALLEAFQIALEDRTMITPVWNKSYREHNTVHSLPESVRKEADDAVRILDWQHDYFVDADHINLGNVEKYISSSDFFTLIEVFASDRVGLLYEITRTIFDLELDIRIAKISTKADQVADVFYVRDLDGQKIEDERQLKEIRDALLPVLAV